VQGYLTRRIAHSLVALLGVTLVAFVFVNASGDPAALLLPGDATPAQAAALRRSLGLDRPFLAQYGLFVWQAVHGNFGVSFRQQLPAAPLILSYAPATAELAVGASVVSVVVAVPLGIIAASYRGRLYDWLTSVFVLIGQSAPIFWLGLMAIWIFSLELRLLPPFGRGTLAQLVLPVMTLAWYVSALLTRMTRASMLEVLDQDYIRTARSKGLSWLPVILKHALRNAAIPVLTVFGLQFGELLGGVVVTETVFAWPGMGRAIVDAINARDYPVVLAGVVVLATIFVAVNLLVDLSYGLLDPRIRYQ